MARVSQMQILRQPPDNKLRVAVMLCCDWWRPTSALNLIGCYFTIGGGAFQLHVSEDEASQKDVCLADVNLKPHCSLQ